LLLRSRKKRSTMNYSGVYHQYGLEKLKETHAANYCLLGKGFSNFCRWPEKKERCNGRNSLGANSCKRRVTGTVSFCRYHLKLSLL